MIVEGPLAKELREIASGRRALPPTTARRHHFVPAFVLARFATPTTRKGWLFQLDTKSGKPQRTTPDSTAFEKDLYSPDDDSSVDFQVESLFSIVERHASAAIQRLTESPLAPLSIEDRQTLSYFLAFQYSRSPVSIEWARATGKALFGLQLAMRAGDAVGFAHEFRENFNADATHAEIENVRSEVHELLRSGRLDIPNAKGKTLELILSTADEVANVVLNLRWRLLYSAEAEFITSDRPLAVYDPSPKFPWSGQAWTSSPDSQTTFPLSPNHCLCIEVGEPDFSTEMVEEDEVRAINLRTYSWASQYIYGRTQELVTRVRRQRTRFPQLLHPPRKQVQVILEEADENDPNVGSDYVKRGWPKGLLVRQPDGSSVFCAYKLVDPSDPKSVLAALEEAPDASRRLIERAIERGDAPPDRLG